MACSRPQGTCECPKGEHGGKTLVADSWRPGNQGLVVELQLFDSSLQSTDMERDATTK